MLRPLILWVLIMTGVNHVMTMEVRTSKQASNFYEEAQLLTLFFLKYSQKTLIGSIIESGERKSPGMVENEQKRSFPRLAILAKGCC